MDEMPLGSGALAATTYPIDRQYVCDQLGFAKSRKIPWMQYLTVTTAWNLRLTARS